MRTVSYLVAVAALVALAPTQALAGRLYGNVPEPTTLVLLSGGVALAAVGARWFRRK